jgi:predicted ferric reductase
MLKKTTSVLLAVSFFILAISGVIMLFDKRLADTLRMDPFHELFAIVMVITGIIHFILNFKLLISYLKIKSIKIIFYSVVGLVMLFYVIFMNIEVPDKDGDFSRHHTGTETRNQSSE